MSEQPTEHKENKEQEKPTMPSVEIPKGPITKPQPVRPHAPTPDQQTGSSDNQPPVIEVTDIQGLSITDRLLQAKGNISIQALTSDVNYFNLANGKLQAHMGSATLLLHAPQLEVDQLKTRLAPSFYKLSVGSSLICFNQKNLSYYVFREDQNVAVLVFKNGETLSLTVGPEQKEQVFTNFAEHHEMITRASF